MPYIQIDNEPMNHKLSPDQYAAIVNLYGPRPREIAPQSRVVACGQKRSNDMNWSEKLIDLAGQNFDILGTHNYEYEPENYATGVRRIEDYLEQLVEYVRRSAHPGSRSGCSSGAHPAPTSGGRAPTRRGAFSPTAIR